MNKMPVVNVLLSTYNGQNFVKQQIDSIFNQKNVQVKLWIRDDGSSDQTCEILKKMSRNDNVHLLLGNNIGWKLSFFELLKIVPNITNQFYAFSDQDDIWMENKLSVAVRMLGNQVPEVYHSNVLVVDNELNEFGNRFNDTFSPNMNMANAFFDSIALGCTMVFNSKLLAITKHHIPTQKTQHDAYVYALGFLLGKVVYDKQSYIFYRRHEDATSGFSKLKNNGSPSLIDRYKKYKNGPKNNFSIRAKELIDGYECELSVKQNEFLKVIASYKQNYIYKLKLIFDFQYKGTGIRRTLQIKYRAIFGTL